MASYRDKHIGEGIGRRYDATHQNKVDALIWGKFVKVFLKAVLSKAAQEGAKNYLDFACGTGRILKIGASIFANSTGIDISPDMLELARERVPTARFYCTDVTGDIDLVQSSFDCVTLFRFLLNAEEELRENVLSWLSKHMPSGALLIGDTHQHSLSPMGIVTIIARRLGRKDLNVLSRSKAQETLERHGFKVIRWSGYRVLPSINGRAIFGTAIQLRGEQLLQGLKLGYFGSEQVFIAKRV